jgi:hypothetical protein
VEGKASIALRSLDDGRMVGNCGGGGDTTPPPHLTERMLQPVDATQGTHLGH